MTEFCNQTKVLDFLSDNGIWVMSYLFWVWDMKIEYWVMKTESTLNQTGLNISKFGIFPFDSFLFG